MNLVFNDEIKYRDEHIFNRLEKKGRWNNWVEIYLNDNSLSKKSPDFEGPNLVLAQGREFVTQRIMGDNRIGGGLTSPYNYSSHRLSHFAIGGGGATSENSNVTLLGPNIEGNSLNIPISLGNEIYKNEPSGYTDMTESPIIHTYEKSVKPIRNAADPSLGDMFNVPVTYESNNYLTKIKCICVIPEGEPSALGAGQNVQISEAGLYFTSPDLLDIKLFAHICFPPRYLNLEDKLTIFWYIIA